jgi:hypothetical protein
VLADDLLLLFIFWELTLLKSQLRALMGRSYDVYFEWGDDRIYCSELVWKAYARAIPGLSVGRMQLLGELKLDGPEVRKLILKRYESIGKQVNLKEPVITPVAILESPDFKTVTH